MLNALKQLGDLKYSWKNNGETLVLQGTGGRLKSVSDPIYLGNAGTAARFLTTVCCLAVPRSAGTILVSFFVTRFPFYSLSHPFT
jgi:pentafunctional AROM polypeptide